MWLFPIHFQMLYDMHMYVYICLYMKVHTVAGVYACLACDAYL